MSARVVWLHSGQYHRPALVDYKLTVRSLLLPTLHGATRCPLSGSASLTCRAWRGPAQRRLLHTVALREKSDLERLCAWLETTGHDGSYFTVLAITFYNRDLCRQKHLTPLMLQQWVHCFPNLREIHVETHRPEAEPRLNGFLASFNTIHTLSVIYGHHEDRYWDEYDSDEEEPDECSCCPDLWIVGYRAILATAPHLLSSVLPRLPRLRHLYLSHFNLFEAQVPNYPKSQITHLSLVRCAFKDWLFDSVIGISASHLRYLSLVQPILGRQNDLASTLAHYAGSLHRLVLICEWQGAAGVDGVQAAGIARDLLPLCANLRELCIHDEQMQLSFLDNMPSLHTLQVTKISMRDLDAHWQASGKAYRQITFHSLRADVGTVSYWSQKWRKSKWQIRLDPNWHTWINAFYEDFLAHLPDPVL